MSTTIFCLAPFINYGRTLIIIIIEAIAIYILLKPSWKMTLLSVIAMNFLSAFFSLLITLIVDPDLFKIFVSSYLLPQVTDRATNSLAFWMILGKLNLVFTLVSLLLAVIFNTGISYLIFSILFKTESIIKRLRTSLIANIASYVFFFLVMPRM